MVRADEIHEVRLGLYFWQAYDPAVKVDLSCCARRTTGGLVFIDPIRLTKAAEVELLTAAPPRAIILTSGNHARAAADWRTRYSIPIYAHAEAIPELGLPVDHLLTDGESVLDEFTVIALPGAAPGEIALQAGDALHLGDALIHLPGFPFGPLPDKYCTDPRELRRSLGKLLRFPFEVLTFAHGLPIVVHARQRLSQTLA
jgi:glyoxylase-like metal-dependent hydrolase (beta-lactamase superfamily II)